MCFRFLPNALPFCDLSHIALHVQVLDPGSKKPVSTIFRFLPDGTRVRMGLGAGASKEVIPIPRMKEDTSKFGLCELCL